MGKTASGLSVVLETQRNTLKVLKDGDILDLIFKFYFLPYLLHAEVLLNIRKKKIILSFDTEITKPLLC